MCTENYQYWVHCTDMTLFRINTLTKCRFMTLFRQYKDTPQVSKFATMISFAHTSLSAQQRVFSLAKNCMTWRISLPSPMFQNLVAKNQRKLCQCSKVVFTLSYSNVLSIFLFNSKNTRANKNRFSWTMSIHFWLAICEYWNFLRKNQIRNTANWGCYRPEDGPGYFRNGLFFSDHATLTCLSQHQSITHLGLTLLLRVKWDCVLRSWEGYTLKKSL